MRRKPVDSSVAHRTCFAVAVVARAVALAACGDEDESAEPDLHPHRDRAKQPKISGPQSAETGLGRDHARRTTAKAKRDLQLIRVEGDHSAEEVVEGLDKAIERQSLPRVVLRRRRHRHSPKRGQSQTVTQVLEPGTYYAFDTEGSQAQIRNRSRRSK